jgi:hypothetical protein
MDCFAKANFLPGCTIGANATAVGQTGLSQSWRDAKGDGLSRTGSETEPKTKTQTGGDECTRKKPLHPNLHFTINGQR